MVYISVFGDNMFYERGKKGQNRKRGNDMEFNDLTDEQKAQVKACKTTEELIALAEAEGVELSDEQLNAIAGETDAPICVNTLILRFFQRHTRQGIRRSP